MEQTPSEMLYGYVRAFETLRPEEVVPFYELPCTFIRPDGTWVVQDEATAQALVNHLIDHARSQRYHRTEISQAATRSLAAGLAELTGIFIRFDAAGGEIARFGFTYIVRGGPEGWRGQGRREEEQEKRHARKVEREHRLVEPVRRDEEVQPHRRGDHADLHVHRHDDAEVDREQRRQLEMLIELSEAEIARLTDLRRDMFGRLLGLPSAYYSEQATGITISSMRSGSVESIGRSPRKRLIAAGRTAASASPQAQA